MNFLRNLFVKKPENIKSDDRSMENVTPLTAVKFKTMFAGIDFDFIELIYFKDELERTDFLTKVDAFLVEVGITVETNFTDFIDLIVKYEENDTGEKIDFIREIFLFEDFSEITTNGKTIIEKKDNHYKIGLGKIQTYYTALKFATTNVIRKHERGYFNFDFEDSVILNVLGDDSLFNYARIDTLCFMGLTYGEVGNKLKSDAYFERILIEIDAYEISPVTISDFFRTIGEYYASGSDYAKALKYFELGLEKNPKLGVKKKVLEIKQLIDKS